MIFPRFWRRWMKPVPGTTWGTDTGSLDVHVHSLRLVGAEVRVVLHWRDRSGRTLWSFVERLDYFRERWIWMREVRP